MKGDPRNRGARPAAKGGPSIDPIKVLRQHVVGIIVSTILGIMIGILAYFIC